MKIGVSVTTISGSGRMDDWMANFTANTDQKVELFVHKDDKGNGVRFSKNQCLKALKDCEYIFLFDDDCYPVNKGWMDFCIKNLKLLNHFQFNTAQIHGEMTTIKVGADDQDVLITYNGGGVFLALTKEVLESVGYMNPKYQGYGWEHLGYSYRIFRDMWTVSPYVCPVGLSDYLYAEDYVNPKQKEFTPEQQKVKNANEMIFLSEAHNLNPKYVGI